MGKQWASGLSLLLSAIRCFTRSAAQGCIGNPSLNPCPAFPNVAMGGPLSGVAAGAGAGAPPAAAAAAPPRCPPPPAAAAAPPRCPPPPAPARPVCHTPEKSGLPSGVLGAGAFKLISPVGVRGAPRLG